MKAAIIAGCAALLLETGTARAAEKGSTLPPAEFDKPFTGELEIVRLPNMQEVEATCKWPGKKSACTRRQMNGARCTIFILTDKYMKQNHGKNAIAFLFRHELGHCNGWGGDHKNGRDVTKEFYHGHIAMPTMPAIVKELPVSPPVICVTPDWKQESCKDRSNPSSIVDIAPPQMSTKDACIDHTAEECELLKTRAIQILKTIPVVPR